jgi:hypothetical protein
MKNKNLLSVVGLVLTLLALPGHGQTPPKPVIEPAALDGLQRMGAYLRTLTEFRVNTRATTEDVLTDGQKLQIPGTVELLAQRPNRLRVILKTNLLEHTYYYDGQTFTLWAERVNLYATVPAPPTLGELFKRLEEKFGIEMPLVDLFRWGTPEADIASITSAIVAGPARVEGTSCTHYAFRQKGLDWQIWIQNGSHPLPRKLVLTTTTDEARPQSEMTYTWDLAPAFNDAAFTFTPPAGAQKIPLNEAKAPSAGK